MKLWDYMAAALLGLILMSGIAPEQSSNTTKVAQSIEQQWIEVWVDETQTGS
ncbi:hypothetical protein [Alginatibacterium sediminis]|uniref:hypothetical protein n=1 Tax=Alginatibacterium sediminis TaxID=2164068 RepID=UPI0013142EAE|nr:hypothetical protein [Alginatibacterium sediminis]